MSLVLENEKGEVCVYLAENDYVKIITMTKDKEIIIKNDNNNLFIKNVDKKLVIEKEKK